MSLDLDQAPPSLGEGPLKVDRVVEKEVAGFAAAGGACGLKKTGAPDLALMVADQPSPVAGVLTRNALCAAPVQVCRHRLAAGQARALLVNSGCANAATGEEGMAACLETCAATAQALGCPPEQVLPGSTGVIGQVLDAAKVSAALPGLAGHLSPAGLPAAAQAIRTTDAFVKMAQATDRVGGRPIQVVGMAKGAGMIRPDMATLLVFLFTDAAASPGALAQVVGAAADLSFNRISVDGDTSTNDTLLLWASGKADNPLLQAGDPELVALGRAVLAVCQELAAMVVADGEGASHLVQVRITGATSQAQARALAYAIAHSPLCKTAFAGNDPNWGRLFSATAAEAGRLQMPFEFERCRLWIGDTLLVSRGRWQGAAEEKKAAATMAQPRYVARLDLGLGEHQFWVLTSDLGHEYVSINADYRS